MVSKKVKSKARLELVKIDKILINFEGVWEWFVRRAEKSSMENGYQNVGRHGFQLSPNKPICAKNVLLQNQNLEKKLWIPLKTV